MNRGTRRGRARSTTTAPPSAVRPVAPATVTPRLRSGSSVSASSSVSPVSVCSGSGSAQRVSAVPADGNTAASATGCSAQNAGSRTSSTGRGARVTRTRPAGTTASSASTTMPSAPSEVRAPSRSATVTSRRRPRPSTRRSPATAADSEPCAEPLPCMPTASAPPTVGAASSSGASSARSRDASSSCSSPIVVPARTRTVGLPGRPPIPVTPRNAERSTWTPSVTASALKECPAPIGRTVWPRSAARRTTADTPLSSSGRTVAVGRHCWPPDQFVHTDGHPRGSTRAGSARAGDRRLRRCPGGHRTSRGPSQAANLPDRDVHAVGDGSGAPCRPCPRSGR